LFVFALIFLVKFHALDDADMSSACFFRVVREKCSKFFQNHVTFEEAKFSDFVTQTEDFFFSLIFGKEKNYDYWHLQSNNPFSYTLEKMGPVNKHSKVCILLSSYITGDANNSKPPLQSELYRIQSCMYSRTFLMTYLRN